MMGEYDTLHQLVHKPKHSLPIYDDGKHDGMVSDDKNGVDDSVICQLSTLKECIELTYEGKKYTDVLDKFLGFWLDARVLDDKRDLS